MASTKNLHLSMTPEGTNKSFLDWRLEQDGTENSNMQKLDAAWGDMAARVDGALAAVGKPTVAETAADMTDQTRAYVYTGSETGYTYGNWYYYDAEEEEWVSGGVYQASAVETDETLRVEGMAADAKATGELVAINETPMAGTKISITTTTEDVTLATMDDVDELKTQLNDISEKSKNILPTEKNTEISINDVTITYENGVVTLNGTASASGGRNIALTSNFQLEANKKYTLAVDKNGLSWFLENGWTYYVQLDYTNTALTFELENNVTAYIGVNVVKDVTYNDTYKIQLVEGESPQFPVKETNYISAVDKEAREFVTPEMYGAAGNGQANDYEAFHKALYSGKPVYLKNTYLLENNGNIHSGLDFIENLPDGCEIFGKGTILFPRASYNITEAQLGLNLFYMNGKCTIRDITVDMTGYYNIVPSGRTLTQYAFYGVANNSIFENVTIKDSAGRNMIYIAAGENNIIKNCKFLHGGTNYALNVYQNDFSFIFAASKNTVITDCTVDGIDSPRTEGNGGIELHGSDSKIIGCDIKNVSIGIYLANDSDIDLLKNLIVSENTIKARKCIDVWYTNELENIIISDNCMEFAPITNVSVYAAGVSVLNGSGENDKPNVDKLQIVNNVLTGINSDMNYAIDLKQTIKNVVVNANNIYAPKTAIRIDGDACIVTNNIIKYGTTDITVTGNNKEVSGNLTSQIV